MTRRSATNNNYDGVQFKDAAKATGRAIRKQYGASADVPLLSHSLSDIDQNGRWYVRDLSGGDVALVVDGKAYLADPIDPVIDNQMQPV